MARLKKICKVCHNMGRYTMLHKTCKGNGCAGCKYQGGITYVCPDLGKHK